jgi:hypothetical protein
MNLAEKILEIMERREKTSKDYMNSQIEKYLILRYPDCRVSALGKAEKVAELTNVGKETAYSWMNSGRGNVKIPLNKLCELAIKLNTDITNFLE